MLEPRSRQRSLHSASQPVTSFVALLLEPGITVAVYLGLCVGFDRPIGRPDLTLALLVLALTLPGRDRFDDSLAAAAVDVSTSWIGLLVILALCGWITSSLGLFDPQVLLWWALLAPLARLLAVGIGQRIVAHVASLRRRPSMIVGAGPLGVQVADALLDARDQGIDFVGYFDDRTDERVHSQAAAQRLGSLKDAPRAVRERGVRDVYITLPLASQPRIVELLEELQGTAASVFFVPDRFAISLLQGRAQEVHGVPIIGIGDMPPGGTGERLKRTVDIVLASVTLVLISPLLLAIAIGVRLGSPGPVIVRQRRHGLFGEPVVVYRFRTTRAPDDALNGDPRLTPFGAFLRRNALDELPQFVNVLQGRMSIVGPPAHADKDQEIVQRLVRACVVRHRARPGITGWAQVNGHRGDADTAEKVQARVDRDLEYLRRWSLGLDLRIIARTVKSVLLGRSAD